MEERLYRLHKGDKSKYVNNTVFHAKGAGYWKKEGWSIDVKPYKYTQSKQGLKAVIDEEAWSKEQEMMERADKDAVSEKTEPVKRTRKKKEA